MTQHDRSQPPAENPAAKICAGCPDTDKCRQAWSTNRQGPLTPAGLFLASLLAFVLPIVLGIAAAAAVRYFLLPDQPDSWWLPLAVLAGLALGALIAWLSMPAIKTHFAASPSNDPFPDRETPHET